MKRLGKRLVELGLFVTAPVLPWALRRVLYTRLLGYRLHPSARIGIALVSVGACTMGERSRIGHFTLIRNMDRLEIAAGSKIGTFNWIFGMPKENTRHFSHNTDRDSALVIGPESSLTSRHILDCTDRISIGAFTTIAGFRSQILTHSIDIQANRQSSRPVTIGDYCMLGSGCIVLKGARMPNGTVLAAGSVFRGAPNAEYQLMSGVPATAIRSMDPGDGYFQRTEGPVS